MTGPNNKIKYEYIQKQRKEGVTYKTIGEHYGVTRQAIQDYCIRYGIEKPKKVKEFVSYIDKKRNIILNNIKEVNGCWEWTRSLSKQGYSRMVFKGVGDYGHRVSYMIYKGNIPYGLSVCHSCDNRKCVNPDHLWLGTHQENIQDMVDKRQVQNIVTSCN